MQPGQRASLLAAKLRAIVADHWSVTDLVPLPFGGGTGASALDDPARAWLLIDLQLVDRDPLDPDPEADASALPRGWLGGTIAWAIRQGIERLDVLADAAGVGSSGNAVHGFTGADARRAGRFARPAALALWRVEGRAVAPVEPEPFVAPAPAPIDVLAFEGIIEAAGAEAVVEDGVLRAEVKGLEVGRVISVPDDGALVLEVGVGRHDRLANQIIHSSVDSEEALRRAVGAVSERRRADAGSHPANQLSRERWLRWVLCRHPELVDAAELRPSAGTVPTRLVRSGPAIAVGTSTDGSPLMVACSVGVDLDAVALGADARAELASGTRLVLCVPDGDALDAQRRIAAALHEPAEVVTVPLDWVALDDLDRHS